MSLAEFLSLAWIPDEGLIAIAVIATFGVAILIERLTERDAAEHAAMQRRWNDMLARYRRRKP